MLKTEELQAFVQIVDAATITAAAERLGLAKSAVSRRLSELEDGLGVELFHRTTRKLTLTDSGQGFYERSIRILADLEEAQNAVSQAHHELSGQLRVAAPFSFGVLHLGPAIIEFQQQHPKLGSRRRRRRREARQRQLPNLFQINLPGLCQGERKFVHVSPHLFWFFGGPIPT